MLDDSDQDDVEAPLLENEQPVVIVSNQSDTESPNAREPRRSRTERFRSRSSAHLAGSRRTPSVLSKGIAEADQQNEGENVAFTIVVNRQGEDDADDNEPDQEDKEENPNRVEVDFVQEAVQEAITEAIQDAVQEVRYEPMSIELRPTSPKQPAGFFASSYQRACRQLAVVQETVTEAIQEAVTAAFEESVRFDVRANFYTLIAITGVILYWRGVWNSWDYFFGLSIWSEAGSVVTGLVVMLTMRYLQVPLVESLPGG